MFWFLDAGNDERLGRLSWPASKKRQGTKSREVGHWLAASAHGDLMLAAVSIMGGTPVRRDVHVRMQVSPGECNGRLGEHTEFVNGRLAD